MKEPGAFRAQASSELTNGIGGRWGCVWGLITMARQTGGTMMGRLREMGSDDDDDDDDGGGGGGWTEAKSRRRRRNPRAGRD